MARLCALPSGRRSRAHLEAAGQQLLAQDALTHLPGPIPGKLGADAQSGRQIYAADTAPDEERTQGCQVRRQGGRCNHYDRAWMLDSRVIGIADEGGVDDVRVELYLLLDFQSWDHE